MNFEDQLSDGPEETNQESLVRDQALEQVLTTVLEATPQISVPPGFALRVGQLAAAETVRGSYSHARRVSSASGKLIAGSGREPATGRRVAFAAAGLLLVVFVVLTVFLPHSDPAHRTAILALWCIFATEFIALTLWLALGPDPLR